jgi:hypothetical protein
MSPTPSQSARPHGGDPLRRLHHPGEGGDRPRLSVAAPGRAQWSSSEESRSTTHSCGWSSTTTREAGVRQLERELGTLLRKVATEVASGAIEAPVAIDEPRTARPGEVLPGGEPYAVPGSRPAWRSPARAAACSSSKRPPCRGRRLAADPATRRRHEGVGAHCLTGCHAEQLGIDPQAFRRRVPVHVPAGAMPKDGPSAGITLVTAIIARRAVR